MYYTNIDVTGKLVTKLKTSADEVWKKKLIVSSFLGICDWLSSGQAAPDTYETYTIRLVNGTTEYEGTVEVVYNNVSGSICGNDDWDSNSANVVCKSLGYSAARLVSYGKMFGTTLGMVHFKRLGCEGSEESIGECPFEVDDGSCREKGNGDAGLVCKYDNPPSVNLTGGDTPNVGQVLINVRGVWGAICGSSTWNPNDGDAICQAFGYSQGDILYRDNRFGDSKTHPMLFDKIHCPVSIRSLDECTISEARHCTGVVYGGVACDEYEDNMLQLSDGTGPHQGRIQYFYNRKWNDVCGKKVDATAAHVLCRSLGYERASVLLQQGGFGDDTKPFFDGISCPLSGSTYRDCRLVKYRRGFCSRSYGAASISCDNHDNMTVSLTGGTGDHEGRVEVFFDRAWGKICGNSQWTFDSADVVCRHNGYDHAFIIYYDDTFNKDNMTTLQFNEVDCEGSETFLTSCTSFRYQEGFCIDAPQEAASLTCTSESVPEIDIRLADGSDVHEGQIEFFVTGEWRKVCGEKLTFKEAEVFCRSLGYERAFALLRDGSAFHTDGDETPFFDELKCNGSEVDITECRLFRFKERECESSYGAASISCESGMH
nr:scavenger receptor cysteine-rich domain superfamily protein-like [Lytechinus pictus]